MNYRNLRVAELIQRELGKIILREVEFGAGILVTITGVEIQKNMSSAKIILAVMPSAAAPSALALLSEKNFFLYRLLMKKINIKPMPRIEFELEKTF